MLGKLLTMAVLAASISSISTDRGEAPPSNHQVAFACQNEVMRLSCDDNEVLRIIRANYGRFTLRVCSDNYDPNKVWDTTCLSLSTHKLVATKCDGHKECRFGVNNRNFVDACPGTYKYIEVQYFCESEPTKPPKRTTKSTTPSKIKCHCNEYGAFVPCTRGACTCRPNFKGLKCGECVDGYGYFPQCTRRLPTTTPTKRTTPKPTRPTSPHPTTPHTRLYCGATAGHNRITWPQTEVGKNAMVECPPDQFGFVSWRCGPNGWIGQPDFGDCKSEWISKLIDEDRDMTLNDLKQLEKGTEFNVLQTADIKAAMSLLKSTSESMKGSKLLMQDQVNTIVNTGSNMLKSRHTKSWTKLTKIERTKIVTEMVMTMENTGFKMADRTRPDESMVMNGENILLEVTVIETASKEEDAFSDVTLPSHKTDTPGWDNNTASFTLPRENIEALSYNSKVKVVFLSYKHLDSMLNMADTTDKGDNSHGEYSNVNGSNSPQWVVNSHIISTSINRPKMNYRLQKPARFTLAHSNTSLNFDPVCSFWNYSETTYMGWWSSSGCRVIDQHSNLTHTTCECDHLTNFAVLMDIHGTVRKLSRVDLQALEGITYAGCIISIVALLLAFITFIIFKNLQCDRNTIHKNLVWNLMLAEIVFLAGIHQTGHPVLCAVIAGFLHFLFLTCFAWMCLEGIHLYFMLIEVFEAEKSRARWYYAFGYGVPTLVVAISAAVHHEGYGTKLFCWLRTDTYFIWSFAGPVSAVITLNIAMLSMTVYMMCRHSHTSADITSKQKSTLQKYRWEAMSAVSPFHSTVIVYKHAVINVPMVKGAFVLVFLLGLTWAFGILFLDRNTAAMAYIFTILNSLQGLAIFVLHCLCNEKYFTRLWSKRKRNSGSSFLMKNSPSRDTPKKRPDSASQENTVLTPGSHQNAFTFHNGHTVRPLYEHDGINGDLSNADCSVINSDATSDYFNRLKTFENSKNNDKDATTGEPLYAEIADTDEVNHYLSVDVVSKSPGPPIEEDNYEIPTERTYSNNCSTNVLPPVKSQSDDSLKRGQYPPGQVFQYTEGQYPEGQYPRGHSENYPPTGHYPPQGQYPTPGKYPTMGHNPNPRNYPSPVRYPTMGHHPPSSKYPPPVNYPSPFLRSTHDPRSGEPWNGDPRGSYRKAITNPQYGDFGQNGRDSINPLLGDFVEYDDRYPGDYDDRYPGDNDATLQIRRPLKS